MPNAPERQIDLAALWADPYPQLAEIRLTGGVVWVPQLDAYLLTRRTDIFREEKRVQTFSSDQPGGLMTVLMGENMMRKDGDAHAHERRATFPALSPRTVRDRWTARFRASTAAALDDLAPQGGCDLVRDFAMRVSGDALRAITGLEKLTWAEVDAVSQGMIDGISNFTADPDIEARCHAATAKIDAHIDRNLGAPPPLSLLAVQKDAGLPMDSLRANIKLAISGGQNEPRDAIAGTVWALLTHPDQLDLVQSGQASWRDAFEEYARWISPIGMSPRRVARADTVCGVDLEPQARAFFMFGAGNRDPEAFAAPDSFDISRDTSASLAFGAGPHFCAGAAASRALIADVALPMLFDRFPNIRLAGDVPFGGWAFRGPLAMPVAWD